MADGARGERVARCAEEEDVGAGGGGFNDGEDGRNVERIICEGDVDIWSTADLRVGRWIGMRGGLLRGHTGDEVSLLKRPNHTGGRSRYLAITKAKIMDENYNLSSF